MARPLRIEYEGAFYHVTARGNERRKIFFTKRDYERFLEYLTESTVKYGLVIHSYVLMTNHYHLLLETPEANVSRAMHFVNGSYTTYVNVKRKRSGHLFQGRFKAIVIDRDAYLVELSRYIHLNPVRAGMVERPEEYGHSSYRGFIGKTSDSVVRPDEVLRLFSTDNAVARKKYRDYVERGLELEAESPFKNLYGGMILGGVRFVKEALKVVNAKALGSEEIAHRRRLRTARSMDEVVYAVCEAYGVEREDLGRDRCGEARKVAVYLLKRYTGVTNREIGVILGGVSYSGVAKIRQRFTEKMRTNRRLRKRIEKIEQNLS